MSGTAPCRPSLLIGSARSRFCAEGLVGVGELCLGPIAQHLVTGWAMQGKGRALWTVGDRLYKVQTVLTPAELALTDTNQALRAQPRPGGPDEQ